MNIAQTLQEDRRIVQKSWELLSLDDSVFAHITIMLLSAPPPTDHDPTFPELHILAGIGKEGGLKLAPDVSEAGVRLSNGGEELRPKLRKFILINAIEEHHVSLR